jgi:acyl carrier protein
MDVVAELRDYVRQEFLRGRGVETIGEHDDLTRILDSVHIMLLARHLEETYQIAVADEEIAVDNFASLAKLAAFVRRKRG